MDPAIWFDFLGNGFARASAGFRWKQVFEGRLYPQGVTMNQSKHVFLERETVVSVQTEFSSSSKATIFHLQNSTVRYQGASYPWLCGYELHTSVSSEKSAPPRGRGTRSRSSRLDAPGILCPATAAAAATIRTSREHASRRTATAPKILTHKASSVFPRTTRTFPTAHRRRFIDLIRER